MHEALSLADKLSVGEFDVGLVHHCVAHSGVNLDMAQEFLHLLHGHSFVYGHSGQCPAELVRMDAGDFEAATQLAEADFNAGNLEPVVRFVQ